MESLSSSFITTLPNHHHIAKQRPGVLTSSQPRKLEHSHRRRRPRLTVSAAGRILKKQPIATTTDQVEKEEEYFPADQGKKTTDNNNNNKVHGAVSKGASVQPSSSFATMVCNALDDFINSFIDGPPRPSVDPRHVLTGNFAPVPELSPSSTCPVVKGSIPPCLGGGAYIRNGPNPQYPPRGPYHLLDGDGMLHSILLPEGGGRRPATFCSRFVRTYKYNLELEAGGPVLPNIFAAFHGVAGISRGALWAARIITGQTNPLQHGLGVANTSLFYFANRLLALWEADLPYAINLSPSTGDMTTVGRCDFDGKLFMGMTAHPKKDPDTGEVFAFRHGPFPARLTYFWFDRAGKKQPDVSLFSLEPPSFVHDFAITKRHAIFTDIQIVVNPTDMVLGKGSVVGTDSGKVPKIGVMPRYATSEREMRWFEVPGFNPIHTLNAWDDGDDGVVLVAPNVIPIEHALERTELVHGCVEMVRIDLRDGTVSRTPLSAENLDFGVINQRYVGKKSRYAYAGIGEPMPKISGVVKLDLEAPAASWKTECVVARRHYAPGCFGGEPFFVPKNNIINGRGGSPSELEDDGYLVTYVHDEKKDESRFLVMDAKSPDLDIVAEVLLPRRVPYGFHGTFIGRSEISSQLLTL